jgi:Leucine-rich repeat (LRR) protein
MDREINLDSIRALEKQIQEHERAIIQLKRTRNSLLNVSTLLPPEILVRIFCWNVVRDGYFGGLPKASQNFLFVCHHWFQVASGTPGLWGFWGNSIQDWGRRHARCRTAPLDLVLTGHGNDHLDDTLYNALQDCAARDTIRRVHLKGSNAELLNSIIFSIITKGEETRSISVQSFILWNCSIAKSNVDISDFFSRYYFPKLQHLDIYGCSISSWDLLRSRITSLTTLTLATSKLSPLPTLSQMLSMLSANPNLECLVLSCGSLPNVGGNRSSPQIKLRQLKTLHLGDDLGCVFELLDRLELPDKMDDLSLSLSECSPSDLPQTLGPYLGNCVRRRSLDRLRLSVDPDPTDFSILVGDTYDGGSAWENGFMTVDWTTSVTLGKGEVNKLCFDIIAHIPLEKVTEVTTTLPILHSEELCVRMCNLTHLHLEGADLSTWFAEPDIREPHIFKDLLRGLCSITIKEPNLSGGDWGPLTDFLTRRTAVGNRISSLSLSRYPHMGEGVVESIRRAVEVFKHRGE